MIEKKKLNCHYFHRIKLEENTYKFILYAKHKLYFNKNRFYCCFVMKLYKYLFVIKKQFHIIFISKKKKKNKR